MPLNDQCHSVKLLLIFLDLSNKYNLVLQVAQLNEPRVPNTL